MIITLLICNIFFNRTDDRECLSGQVSGSGTAARVSSQPSPRRCLVSWHHTPHILGLRQRASRLRTLRRIIAGLPDAVSSMRPAIWPAEYGDEHSGIRRLESRWAAAWDHRQQLQPQPDAPGPSRIRGAPDPSTDASWMRPSQPRPSPVETDAHRSHFLQHQPSRQSLRRGSACMLRYAAMISTSLLWQRHTLPALSGHTHGEPLSQLPWIGLEGWWPGVCCLASSSWASTGTSTEARRSRSTPPRHA